MAEQLVTQVTVGQTQKHTRRYKKTTGQGNAAKKFSKPSKLPVLAITNKNINNNKGGITVTQNSPRDRAGLNSPRLKFSNDENDEESAKHVATRPESPGDISLTSLSDDELLPSPPKPEIRAPWKTNKLLPPLSNDKKGKKCLVLDLDETLVHSSFHPVACDFVIPVEIEGFVRSIYVAKRPYVDEFLKACGELFEVVVFTASLAKYADPLLDLLDIHGVINHRLFRESCSVHCGTYVKDLFRIGRPLPSTIIIDNSPHSYVFNPQNALPCESWFDDQSDCELLDILTTLNRLAESTVSDVMAELDLLDMSGLSLVPVPVIPPAWDPDTDEEDEGRGE